MEENLQKTLAVFVILVGLFQATAVFYQGISTRSLILTVGGIGFLVAGYSIWLRS